MMQPERDSFVFISTSAATLARLHQASEFLSFEINVQATLKLFLDQDAIRPRTLLLDMREVGPQDQDFLVRLRQLLPKSQVVGLIEKKRKSKNRMVYAAFYNRRDAGFICT